MKNEYNADFTNDRLLLAIFKLTSENNALLKVMNDSLLEIRKDLKIIEADVEGETNEEYDKIKNQFWDPFIDEIREKIQGIVKSQEQVSMKEAFEWSWMNDPGTSIGDI